MARRESIRVVDVSLAEPENGLRKAHLDTPAIGEELDANALKIVGWAVGRERPVDTVEVAAAGEVVATTAVVCWSSLSVLDHLGRGEVLPELLQAVVRTEQGTEHR